MFHSSVSLRLCFCVVVFAADQTYLLNCFLIPSDIDADLRTIISR